ncbi:hypothetical protein BDZ94DRAFT_1258594 [Collybia nuda]|uniref:SET domain-containing protein n=1 Tax=Collybia nuda TaxID=64659 RepID=A0A9P5Y4W2_9AGAR|nr:hypothetical protein BDZ94DRAFT_1258594 [Collybia nuda]
MAQAWSPPTESTDDPRTIPTLNGIITSPITTQSWSSGSQDFVVHNVHIQTHDPNLPPIECAMLLDSRMIKHLPKNLVQQLQPAQPCFEIKDAGDKGAGMFATRDIPAGALILVENPVIITPASILLPEKSGAYQTLFNNLPLTAREELLTMTNCRSREECNTDEEGIARTNGTGIDLAFPLGMEKDPTAKEYGAVFLKINRSNHSCGPNAAHKWDLASFSSSLYALRPISVGEEITMIYTDVTASREVRRAKLKRLYGFDCGCTYCDLPDEESIVSSDAARAQLRDWGHTHPGYLKWSTDLCRADDVVIKSHQNALRLIEREGMQGLQCLYMEEIVLSYAILGEESEFRAWGERLLKLCTIQDRQLAEDLQKWLANPKSMKKWAWRKKQRMQTSGSRRRCVVPPSPDMLYLPLLF